IGAADVDAKALDKAIAFDDGAAGLPKHAPLARARLGAILSVEAERAGLGFDLAHGISLWAASRSGIGPTTDPCCGLLPKHAAYVKRRRPLRSKRSSREARPRFTQEPPGAGPA